MKDAFNILTDGDFTFEEAARYFKDRIPVSPGTFYRLSMKYRSLAFTVSGYTKAEILNQFFDTLAEAIEEGTTMEKFRKDMNSYLTNQGYEGITAFQADNIYRTNVQTAYHAGHYERLTQPEVLERLPYWMYDCVDDGHSRLSHVAMNGKVIRADSTIWDTWYPPNGYRCRCSVRALSREEVERRGLKVTTELPDRAEIGASLVPLRPDSRFATNPAKTQFEPDMEGYPQSLRDAFERRETRNPASAM